MLLAGRIAEQELGAVAYPIEVVQAPEFLDELQVKLCTVNNKKTHLADFETCAFRVYLRNHLSYKKLFSSICILI